MRDSSSGEGNCFQMANRPFTHTYTHTQTSEDADYITEAIKKRKKYKQTTSHKDKHKCTPTLSASHALYF